MQSKIVKLLVIIGMAVVIVSCGKSTPGGPGTNPSSDQTQSSQPSNSSQAQSGQVDETSPSAFQGGITAREGYEQALQKAVEWSPSAILSEVAQTTVNLEGKSTRWIYYFV